MSPILTLLITEIVKNVPVLAVELVEIFSKDKITDADWAALKAKYEGKTYEDYIKANEKPC